VVAARRIAPIALACLAGLVLATTASAKPGQVDGRYGYNGTVDLTAALPGAPFSRGALAEAVGPQDESFVLSYALRPCAGPRACADLYVTRVLADGAIDAGFGARAGIVASVEWGSPDRPGEPPRGAIAVQPDGRVVVASGDGLAARIARLNADGSHDLTFHTPGDVDRPPGQVVVYLGGETTVAGVAIREKGGVVVAGSSRFAGGPVFFVARVLEQGQRDREFGVAGIVFDSFQPGGMPGGLALRGEATLLAGPACCAGSVPSMAFAQLDASGDLASSFRVRPPKRLAMGKPKGVSTVVPGPKGSTFVVGSAAKGTFVVRYRGDGRPDPRFGDGGFALVKGLRTESPSAAVLDGRGRIVVLGWRLDVPDTAGYRAPFVSTVRLLPSGKNDQTYGGARPLLVVEEGGEKVGLDFSRSLGLVQRADGKLIMLGEAPPDRYAKTPTAPNFGLVRYLAGGPLRKK
jgi:uncharacterized delta-60 repeat protein